MVGENKDVCDNIAILVHCASKVQDLATPPKGGAIGRAANLRFGPVDPAAQGILHPVGF